MLTRLKVDGFKNLDNIDVRFGPFTCIAGQNGVGKSNLFDAIAFLAGLADKTLIEAAMGVRGVAGRGGDVRAIFSTGRPDDERRIDFEVEMIVPQTGVDDLGSAAAASATFLRYRLSLGLRAETAPQGPLEVLGETMEYLTQAQARKALKFPHTNEWRESVVKTKRTVPYIRTRQAAQGALVVTAADSSGEQGGGRPRSVLARSLPRTVLSSANNAAEYRTLVLARHEMMSWAEFQLEPTALRRPDRIHTPPGVGADGAHLAATLHGLCREADAQEAGGGETVRAELTNHLARLLKDVRDIRVDLDERRDSATILVRDLSGAEFSASQLSDGTLRFLAIAVLQADRRGPRLLCFEEPENGIHPLRIRPMLELFASYATDVTSKVDDENPLRQVVVNTHSPLVVGEVDDDALVLAIQPGVFRARPDVPRVVFLPLERTWRCDPAAPDMVAGRTDILEYLAPHPRAEPVGERLGRTRVADRPEAQIPLFGTTALAGK